MCKNTLLKLVNHYCDNSLCSNYASNKKNKKEEKDKKNNFYQNSSFTSFSQQAKPVLSAGAAQIRALAQGGCHE